MVIYVTCRTGRRIVSRNRTRITLGLVIHLVRPLHRPFELPLRPTLSEPILTTSSSKGLEKFSNKRDENRKLTGRQGKAHHRATVRAPVTA